MAKKIGIDQTGAWVISVFITLLFFAMGSVFLKKTTELITEKENQELKAHQELMENEKKKNLQQHDETKIEPQFAKSSESDSHNNQKVISHWAYDGSAGPDHWGDLSAEFSACAIGKSQSPIDIRDAELDQNLLSLGFSYSVVDTQLTNTGYTIKAKVNSGNQIKFRDTQYALEQLHFHSPGEHYVNGVPFEMEMHLVHKNKQGGLLVVAVFIENSEISNESLAALLEYVPYKSSEFGPHVKINPNEILPKNRGYFVYDGSLTTPPCSEGVKWIIMKSSIKLSGANMDKIKKAYHLNARPIQERSDRKVFESRF